MLNNLIRFLPIAEKVINRRTTLPILEHVCLRNGYLIATDLENTICMKVDDDRNYTMPLNILKVVLKAKPKVLEIDVLEDGKVEIRYDTRTVSFQTRDPKEFPNLPEGKYEDAGKWTLGIIKMLYSQLPYTSSDELKPALTGVLVHQNGTLSSCATDGHILRQIMDVNLNGEAKLISNFKAIIPKKALQILSRAVKTDVNVAFSDNHLRLKLNKNMEFFVRLIEDRYPEFEDVIPKQFSGSVALNMGSFTALVKDAKPFVNSETKQCEFAIQKSIVEVCVTDNENDVHWNSDLPVINRDGEDITIGLNLVLLEKILKGIDENDTLWQYNTPLTASVLTGINGIQPNILNLVMPIRIEEDEDE